MTLRMGDGPPGNLPAGLDAYAGYTDDSGIGVTWPAIEALPARWHLSISVHGQAPAMCGDVETGALADWSGYTVGYCAISNAQALINRYGRPRKLWTAHYDPALGAHICSPSCGFGFTGHADGTQWTDHGGLWDESLLEDDFFDFLAPPVPLKEGSMYATFSPSGILTIVGAAADNGDLLVLERGAGGLWTVSDVTDAVHNENPADPRSYKIT